jgi:hypothetical protein
MNLRKTTITSTPDSEYGDLESNPAPSQYSKECYYTNPFHETAAESVKFVNARQQLPIFPWVKG